MNKKKKKKNHAWIKFLVFALVLLVIIGASIITANVVKHTKDEGYQLMQAAELPLISVSCGENYVTELHGYVNEMDLTGMRDVIVPLSSERKIDLSVATYGKSLESLEYEVWSLDNSEYVDGGSVTKFTKDADDFCTSLKLSDLMVSGKEYQLVLKLNCDGKPVNFYTRIIYAKTNYVKELLGFATEFSEANFDREKAASFIVNYIQPEDESDTSDFHYTDIHSKYTMFTFGSLSVERGNDVLYRITELEPTQVSVNMYYHMKMLVDGEWKEYLVDEFFCVRYRSEKVYLLDYHREIRQVFVAEESTKEKGRISLGISGNDTQVLSSENNDITVFVQNRQLWSYNGKTNAMNLIFSFYDASDSSNRSSYDHHDIQIVNVSDEGDIDYMVYGYMNRGSYEGQVGICFYRYTQAKNSTRRLFYMPVTQSEQILMMDLGTLAYVNTDDVCYLRYGDGIYSINLNSGENVEVTIRAYPGAYAMNKTGNVVAWTEGEDLTYPSRIVILNMDTQTTAVVDAGKNEYIKILDFIGNDIVYGFGRKENSVIEANIDTSQLMDRLCIASTDEQLTIQQEYTAKDCYILSAGVSDTRLTIQRVLRVSDSVTESLPDDVLLLTQSLSETGGKSMLKSRKTDPQKREYYIQISSVANTGSQFSSIVPRFEVMNDANMVQLQHHQTSGYYVYGYGRLLYVESDINQAIREAYDRMGVVIDENMNYIWTRGTRDLAHTISIQPFVADSGDGTLAASLRVLAAQEGMQLPTVKEDLSGGLNPLQIIDRAIGEGRALNLYGCTVSEIEYFINENHPVLAIMGNREAVVISGYTMDSIEIYMPATGETYTLLKPEAEKYFKDAGSAFISYR